MTLELGFWPDDDARDDDARRASVEAQAREWAAAEPLWDLAAILSAARCDHENHQWSAGTCRMWVATVELVPVGGAVDAPQLTLFDAAPA